MKEWQAYLELKQQIDDFNECCPLLESLANKALIDRYAPPQSYYHMLTWLLRKVIITS